MPDILLRGGRVIDPSREFDAQADVLLTDGKIARIERGLAAPSKDTQVIEAKDCWVVPGLIDLHVHLREPGQEYKEDIQTGTAAAAAGGFTAVCCMPNTNPPNDNRAVTELIVRQAQAVGSVRVYPVGCITQGQKGETMADMGELQEAGCVAVSDDGRGVANSEVMRRALEYSASFHLPIVQHCEDAALSAGGAMHEGVASTRFGIRAQPAAAESAMLARDLELVALTGGRYHMAHISCMESIRLIRNAKLRGLPVTCEVPPHNLMLTDVACSGYDTSFKMNPPLRSAADQAALREALADGTIDAIATDHAPHSSIEKDVEFEQAANGVIGLETAVALAVELVELGVLTAAKLVMRMSVGPARVMGLPGGSLAPGGPADLTVIDPRAAWTCDPARFRSKARNTPFAGRTMRGRAVLTVVGGKIVFAEEKFVV
ncbi:MAG TPA: dihydroorotase [Polyangia bacterium]